ncbi:hypothetical protein [Zunongwangia pacifica]|uniref:Uncharacterized protein n=1 Tax=Zunongwangia pacifica TaxID=2911062 RepID=A0A9X1ZVU9_9FLAO|nr:hypothetical protein [Zunongwangia pacifica]MCL6220135.1 hypothetical protein [Zunongwangia pacifica]
MKLYYSGNHTKIRRLVHRANQLIVSPFYLSELKKYLVAKGKEDKFDLFKGLLDKDQEILVKTYLRIFSGTCIELKHHVIAVNTFRLNKSHRDLLALLTENMYREMDAQLEISNLLNLNSKPEKETFFKEIGAISKSYI